MSIEWEMGNVVLYFVSNFHSHDQWVFTNHSMVSRYAQTNRLKIINKTKRVLGYLNKNHKSKNS